MPVFTYTARSVGAGQAPEIRGTITADSPRSARDQLRRRGLSIRRLDRQSAGRTGSAVGRYLTRRQRVKVTGLLQELATLLSAGIPLLEALETASRQHRGRFRQGLLLLRDHVAAGGSLGQALAAQSDLFDPLCVSIVEVGENAGTLDVSLTRLVEYRRTAAGLKNRVASALMYPMIVLAAGIGVSLFLMAYVVPNLLDSLAASGKDLPAATRIVRASSELILHWWWLMALAAGGALAGFAALLRSEKGGRAFDRAVLRIPLLGDLIRKQSVARMSMVLAALLKSGLTFVHAIRIVRPTIRNRVIRDALVSCEQAVGAGQDISAALEQTEAFDPLVVQIFAVGQASGHLEKMLENLAADYETQVELTSQRLTTLLEPLMMILLAIVVGFIAFATMLPILEAGNVL
ncbi:MAG: type II secretion system F family protein [Phycisphaerae bacterium]